MTRLYVDYDCGKYRKLANHKYIGLALQFMECTCAARSIDRRSRYQFHMVDLPPSLDLR
jgi:hypothetical protein